MHGLILRHAFKMLTRNFGNALKISVGPAVLLGGIIYFLLSRFQILENPEGTSSFYLLITMFAFLVLTSWVPVLWHRFILLEEYPAWLPVVHMKELIGYVGRVFGVSMIILAAVMIGFLVIGVISIGLGNLLVYLAPFLEFGVTLVVYYLTLRFSLALTGITVGHSLPILESFRMTASVSKDLFQIALILGVLNYVLSILLVQFEALFPTSGILLWLPFIWLEFMFGLSVQTTLYGLLVEKRDLT